ncbi:MAG: protein kinase domain-containing protein [Vicinamibacterales bacterium]
MTDPHDLDELAASVADGTPLDWDRIESTADERSRPVVRNLRAMAAMAGLHRTLSAECESPRDSPALRTVATPGRPLATWGHFALEQHIGSGSFGEVFRAIDTRLDRVVAVKLARREVIDENASLVEARLLARVRHRNVVSVYGADVFDGRPGLWMEFIEGQALSTVLLRQGAFGEGEAAAVGLQLCRALAAVHDAGLLHRDIKAQNVMRESGGRIVLMDFGGGRDMSARPRLGGDTGTPLYLAPEVLAGYPATARSDVYAVGVLLYHLVTREYPVRAADALSLSVAHDSGRRTSVTERRPDLSPRFAQIVERATAPEPEARYARAGAMAADLAAALNAEAEPAAAPASVLRPRPRRITRALAVAAVLVAAVGVWWASGGRPGGGVASVGSILVLPLDDASDDTTHGYLTAGFTNALAEDIGRIRSLRIVTSVQAKSHPVADAPALARSVGADAYLQGTLRRTGDRLVLTIRLVDAGNGTVHWSGSFDRAANEGLSLNREIARTVAEELQVALSPEERQALSGGVDVSARAQDAYLRGWAEYQRLSRDGALEAARQFEEAVALQPAFAAAHAALSHVYWSLGTSHRTMSPAESRTRAEASALRALELDPLLPNAYAALGQIRFYYDWDWRVAEELFRRAIDLNPNLAQIRSQYGSLLAVMNRLGPAQQEMRAALDLEPDNVNRRASLAVVLYYGRRFTEAIAEINRVVDLDPNSLVGRLAKARYLVDAGYPREAIHQIALARHQSEPAVIAELARAQARAGDPDAARSKLPELVEATNQGRLARDYLSFVYLAVGDSEQAIALLQSALADRSPTLVWVQVDPRFDALRNDPRFVSLLRAMGFEQ